MGSVSRYVERASRRVWRQVARRQAGHFSRFGEDEIISQELRRLLPVDRVCVDIGAGDGIDFSNTYRLFADGWKGLAIEGDARSFEALARRYARFADVQLARVWVTPDNIVPLLQAAAIPRDVSVVSLDIDGYDYFVLKALLERFRPKLLMVEINEKIPPPVKFAVGWNPSYVWAGDHFYGMSIAMLDELCQEHRYAFVCLEYNNAILMPIELAISPVSAVDAYRTGYLDRTDRLEKLPWNHDMEFLHGLEDGRKVSAVSTYFAKYTGNFVCRL